MTQKITEQEIQKLTKILTHVFVGAQRLGVIHTNLNDEQAGVIIGSVVRNVIQELEKLNS